PAELAADLLQAILIGLSELLDRDFSIADLGETRAAEAPKDVVDAPNGKAARQQRHDRTHDTAAKPIFRGFANTPKHAANFEIEPIGTTRRRTIRTGQCCRNRWD